MNEKDHIIVEKFFHEEIFGKSVTFQMGPNANAIIGVDALMLIFISHEDCMKTKLFESFAIATLHSNIIDHRRKFLLFTLLLLICFADLS